MFSNAYSRGAMVVGSLTVILAAGLQGLPAATAAFGDAPPVIVGPTGTTSNNSPVLTWNRVSGATAYEVQVDDSAGFTSPEWSATTVNSRSVPTALLKSGAQNWRVRGRNVSGTTTPWAVAQFTVSSIGAPTPLTPTHGQDLAQPSQPPLLSWTALQGATSYTVEVDNELEFVSPLSYTTRSTSLVVPVNQPAGDYVWRVKGIRGNGVETVFSLPSGYTVLPINTPQITGPATNAQVEDVVLDWTAVPGAKWYELQVDDDADFGSVVQGVVPDRVYGTKFSPKTTFANDQYFWRVRAVDLSGEPTEWDSVDADTFFSFTRNWHDTPVPVHPAGVGTQHVGDDLYYEWTPVQHASNYELWISTDENFTVSNPTTKQCHVAGTTYTPGETDGDNCMPSSEGLTVYYWKVRPMDRPYNNAGVPGIFSATNSFVYDDSQGIVAPSPSGGQTVDIPTFSWAEVPSTEKYELRIFKNNGDQIHFRETYSNNYTPMNMPKLLPAQGPYTWSIKAYDVRGNHTVAHVYPFQVTGNIPAATGAGLTPTSGRAIDPATRRFPALRWQPVAGADHYRVHIGDKETNTWWAPTEAPILNERLVYPAATDVSERFLATGEYDWYVSAHDSGGALLADGRALPAGAGYGTFKIAALGVPTGQRIALTGAALDNDQACTESLTSGPEHVCTGVPTTPILDWEPVPGASYYRIHVSRDADFSTGALDPTPPGTTNTRWTPNMSYPLPALDDSDVNQAYHWYIQPCKTALKCGPDPTSTINPAKSAFRKSSPALQLLTPVNDDPLSLADDITTTEVTFDWADYFDTNLATTYAPTGEESNQSAMRYQIQVDTQPNFAAPLVDEALVDQSTYTAADRLYPEGPLYWRVQAIDVANNQLGWSATRTAAKRSVEPTLTSPVNVHVSGGTPFQWAAQSYAGRYEVQVAKNGDTQFSVPNRVIDTLPTTQPAFTTGRDNVKLLPASTLPYVWRVRRVDPFNNPGPWSAVRQFYVDGAKPTLVSPVPDVWVTANDALFTWTAVPGATQYRLEYKLASATYPNTVTTPATSFAPLDTLPDGAYQWRVTAMDVEGVDLGSSEWRSFNVDGTRPTVVTTAPFMLGKRASNFVVTFSEKVYGVSRTTFRLFRKGSSTAISATVTLSTDRKKAILNPTSYLVVGRTYVAKLTSGIKDVKGNTLVPKSYEVKIT